MFGLSACTGITPQPSQTEEVIDTRQAARFDAWETDLDRHNDAVRQLVALSDRHIADGQFEQASSVLERSLRIDNRVAVVWSRLAWLAMEAEQYRRAQNLLIRSNSLTTDAALLRLNWELYRDASDYANDHAGVDKALRKLDAYY